MKKALKLVVLILVLSFIVDKVVYYSLNKLSDKVLSGQAIGKLNQYLFQKDDLNVIAYGTSRANHHIDVSLLDTSSFNMGMDGSSLAYSSTLIKLLPKNKKQTVIWHIDPKKVFDSNYDGEDIKGLVSKYHRNDIIQSEINKVKQNNPLQLFYWSIDYNGKAFGILKNLIRPNYDFKTYNGYDPINVSQTQKEIFESTLEKKDAVECPEDINASFLAKEYIKSVKLFCEQNNKTLVMLTSPTYNPICKEQYLKLEQMLKKLNINYYNYSEFFISNNSLNYWKDKTHLSTKGASLFSEALKTLFTEKGII